MFHTIRQISQILPFKTGKEKKDLKKLFLSSKIKFITFSEISFRLDLPKIFDFFHSTFVKILQKTC